MATFRIDVEFEAEFDSLEDAEIAYSDGGWLFWEVTGHWIERVE